MDNREEAGGTGSSRERESQGAVRYHQTVERYGIEEDGSSHQQGWEAIKSKEERQARWKEHFERVLNGGKPPNPPTDEEMEEVELGIDAGLPTEEEIERAVQTLKNEKASEIGQITTELLKADTESTCVELKRLFDLIWQNEKVPVQYKQGLICKIPKKGNAQQCGNWRGVTLLPTASKVLGKILISRIQGDADDRLRKEQAGFRPGRGPAEQIFIRRNILEQVDE